MIVTTGNDVAGHAVSAYLGIVAGWSWSPTIMQGITGGLKQIVGGNIESYASACEPPANKLTTALSCTRKRSARTPLSRCATTRPSFPPT